MAEYQGTEYTSNPEGGGNFGGAQISNVGEVNYDQGSGSGSPYDPGYSAGPLDSTPGFGPGSNNQGTYNDPIGAPNAPEGGFIDSIWDSFKRWGTGRAFGAVGQRMGSAAPLLGPGVAAYNAPGGKGGEAFTRNMGASTINGMMYGINPILGGLNSLWGAATGKTLGSWFAGAHDNPNGYNQNTAASGGDASRNGWDNALTGLAGLYAGNKANQTLKEQSNSLSGMYGQSSPFAQVLRSNLERNDAAAGRRSQSGSREVQLQAKLAEMASRNAPTIANLNQQRTDNKMKNLNSLMYLGRQSGLFNGIGNMFKDQPMTQNDMANWGTGPEVPFEG